MYFSFLAYKTLRAIVPLFFSIFFQSSFSDGKFIPAQLCLFVEDLIFVGLTSARSFKVDVVGNNCLVGNNVFSETALRIFLTFYIKLGDYKGRKVKEPDF